MLSRTISNIHFPYRFYHSPETESTPESIENCQIHQIPHFSNSPNVSKTPTFQATTHLFNPCDHLLHLNKTRIPNKDVSVVPLRCRSFQFPVKVAIGTYLRRRCEWLVNVTTAIQERGKAKTWATTQIEARNFLQRQWLI